MKLKAFPFTLKEVVEEWLFSMTSESIRTWNDLKRKFLEKYFYASQAVNIRKEICGIRQLHSETLSKY
jgi:hypothetical protein